MITSSEDVRITIKELRGKSDISQDQLAKKADIPFSTLVKIEAGYTPNPSMETLIKIADAFEVTIDEKTGVECGEDGLSRVAADENIFR